MTRQYFDFDLMFSTERSGYSVRAYSQGRSAGHEFDLPFDSNELETFFGTVGNRPVRAGASKELEMVRAFGARLSDAVFDDALSEFFRECRRNAQEQDRGLRIRVSVEGAPELADVPWEYLYRPASDDFPGLSNWTPIVRYQPTQEMWPRAAITLPVRICVAISNPIEYQDTLDVELEWEQLQQSLRHLTERGDVELHRLEQATEEALQRELRRADYHVFHFVGHGEFNEASQDGVLLFENERRRTKLVSGRALGTILRDSRHLRLVVLNNCESARAAEADPFGGVAQSLIRIGVPAVVAMQFKISDDAAIAFSEEFYSGIGDGYPVDAALAEARKAINRTTSSHEFGSPVLYMGTGDAAVFDIDRTTSPPRPEPPPDDGLPRHDMPATHDEPPDPDQPETGPVPEPPLETVLTRLGALFKSPRNVVIAFTTIGVALAIWQFWPDPDPEEARITTVTTATTAATAGEDPTGSDATTTTEAAALTTTPATTTTEAAADALPEHRDLYAIARPHTVLIVDSDADGTLEVIEPNESEGLGDFDGDGFTDLFIADGETWAYRPSGIEEPIELRSSSLERPALAFGDFDGDGVTDVFHPNGVAWNQFSGGVAAPFQLITSGFGFPRIQVGDYDGDGATDVFTRMAAGWEVSFGGVSVWQVVLAAERVPDVIEADMRLGDFDGDGATDVFFVEDDTYKVGFGATRVQSLQPAVVPLDRLRFGDVDQDGRTDLLYLEDGQWLFSSGGSGEFVPVDSVRR